MPDNFGDILSKRVSHGNILCKMLIWILTKYSKLRFNLRPPSSRIKRETPRIPRTFEPVHLKHLSFIFLV